MIQTIIKLMNRQWIEFFRLISHAAVHIANKIRRHLDAFGVHFWLVPP